MYKTQLAGQGGEQGGPEGAHAPADKMWGHTVHEAQLGRAVLPEQREPPLPPLQPQHSQDPLPQPTDSEGGHHYHQQQQLTQQEQPRFFDFPKVIATVNGTLFAVDPRYSIRCPVGQGAQGVLCSAVDLRSNGTTEVAIKKLPNVFDDVMGAKRLLRELRLLRHLRHDNILSLRDILLPPSTNVMLWRDVYLVSPLMDTDLDYVITSGQASSPRPHPNACQTHPHPNSLRCTPTPLPHGNRGAANARARAHALPSRTR